MNPKAQHGPSDLIFSAPSRSAIVRATRRTLSYARALRPISSIACFIKSRHESESSAWAFRSDLFRAFEIGNRPRHPADLVIRPRAEAHFIHRLLHQKQA